VAGNRHLNYFKNMGRYKEKICILCMKMYKPSSGRQNYCKECIPKRTTIWQRNKALEREKIEVPKIKCACGCGRVINSVSKWGRTRKYITGHSSLNVKRTKEEIEKSRIKRIGRKRSFKSRMEMSMKKSKEEIFTGFKTSLNKQIRSLPEYFIWRSAVFERDNWTCQTCRKRGNGTLNAHHIKNFNVLRDNFLETYKHLNLSINREQLPSLAAKYKDFWDVNNGITLCENCHNLTKRRKKMNKENEEIVRIPPVNPLDILKEQKVISIGKKGEGVIKYCDYIIFCTNTKVGEIVDIKIDKVFKNFAIASKIENDEGE
jgi:predicted RNA-binding protein with TRAM domain